MGTGRPAGRVRDSESEARTSAKGEPVLALT